MFLSAHAPAASPVAAAYARLAEALPALRVTEEPPRVEPGWVSAAALAEDRAVRDAYLAGEDARIRRDYGRPARPDVVASFALHRYAWPACLLITLPYLLSGRVPRIPLSGVSFRLEPTGMTVAPTGFACLPGDPAAVLPGAREVPDEEALRAELRQAVADHMAPVLEAFRPRMRRGSRALWGTVTDEIVEGLWYVGRLLGLEERARAESERLLPGGTAPYPGGASFRQLAGPHGRQVTTRERASCCLFYTLRPEDMCVTCPRNCDARRVERLTADSASAG